MAFWQSLAQIQDMSKLSEAHNKLSEAKQLKRKLSEAHNKLSKAKQLLGMFQCIYLSDRSLTEWERKAKKLWCLVS